MLLMTWFDEPFRGTRDLDLLGYGDPAPGAVLDVFREVLGQEQPDGVVFDAGAARLGRILEENRYGGLRIRATADIAGARMTVNVDVGFGDATEPPAEWLDYPVLLDMPAPRLRGYARETVVAEAWCEWRHVIQWIVAHHPVIESVPRGPGDPAWPASGYDKRSVSEDIVRLLSGHPGPGR